VNYSLFSLGYPDTKKWSISSGILKRKVPAKERFMEAGRKKIILVDDSRTSLITAKKALADRYDILTAPSGKKLFELLERTTPDLILLDIEMPEMGGYDVIKILKDSEESAYIPVIFLSGRTDLESEIEGLELGAVDYIFKPFSQKLLLRRIESHLALEMQRQELKRYSMNLEGKVVEQTRAVSDLKNIVLRTVADLVECRDSTTGGHIERTQNYLKLLVNFLLKQGAYAKELSSWDIDLFVMSSQLHDVGKISIRDCILLKPDKLTAEEFEEMKAHTVIGGNIIEKIKKGTVENAFLEHAKILALNHHEKWDGTGYPLGLKGEEIPLQGRLMALIDVYDALTNDRPYKKAYSHDEAVEIIKDGMGTHFDPLVCKIFLKYEQEFASAHVKWSVPGASAKKPE
jgi:putative two-component system response regulator